MVMGSLDMVEMPLQLCSKFNSGNCKLLPITNHFGEVPFTKTIILFLKATFSSVLEWMVFTNTMISERVNLFFSHWSVTMIGQKWWHLHSLSICIV